LQLSIIQSAFLLRCNAKLIPMLIGTKDNALNAQQICFPFPPKIPVFDVKIALVLHFAIKIMEIVKVAIANARPAVLLILA